MVDYKIPVPLIGITANILGEYFTHSDITNNFLLCDYPDTSIGNKIDRIQRWLIHINAKDSHPLNVYGIFISSFLDYEYSEGTSPYKEQIKLEKLLSKYGITYETGGKIYKDNNIISISELNKNDILNHEFIKEQVLKANQRLSNEDYDGAITSARSLMEAVQEELIKKCGKSVNDWSGDILRLYKQTRSVLNMEFNENLDNSLKQILQGLTSVINGIASLSNNIGDRHSRQYKPSRHHAQLIVNSSFTFCEFLISTYEYQQVKNKLY